MRLVRWIWESAGISSWIVRVALLPFAVLYKAVMWIRGIAYRYRWVRTSSLPLRSIAVGNLTVGGTGKTPVSAWLANWFLRHGARPAILLRGYGDDEPLVHARLAPKAVVQANPDRHAGATAAARAGADLLVLDDALQTLRIRRDINLVLVAAEHLAYSPFPLPAGPWREGWGALGRADGIIVTRKLRSAEDAARLADRIAKRWPKTPVGIVHLAISGFEGLRSGQALAGGTLAGRRLLAAAGIADPDSFAAQLQERTGKSGAVQLVTYQDHHAYTDADVTALLNAAATADYVVVTEKDAVKLRSRWPAEAREPLVATLGVQWERGHEAFEALLSTLINSSTPAI
ncbi:MAG TPA: tetraacyldisaccharide 4'-kinase [Gemmatimonadales bacterium]|nr:tetraacyldisaccharide 4'-kinase [Gemmatimonadales bacterium]